MALSYDQISAITQVKIMPKLVDNIFKQIPLLSRMKKKETPIDGGTMVQVPLEYAQNGAGGAYSGADTLNNSDNDVITAASFDWKQYYQSIVINRRDELKNSGDAAILKFVTSKVKNAEKSLRDLMATAAWVRVPTLRTSLACVPSSRLRIRTAGFPSLLTRGGLLKLTRLRPR